MSLVNTLNYNILGVLLFYLLMVNSLGDVDAHFSCNVFKSNFLHKAEGSLGLVI